MPQKTKNILVIVTALAWLLLGVTTLIAQEADSEWSEPVNISQSGSTTNPVFLMERDGSEHVIWQDTFIDNYRYSQNAGSGWSQPISVTLPFENVKPQMVLDNNNVVHAFWIDFDEETFLYSYVGVEAIADLAAWAPVQTIASSAADMDVLVDGSGRVHLLYLLSEETDLMPAGIYYQRTTDGGETWSTTKALYQSPYLRGTEAEDANVELTATENNGRTWLFAAWDNRSRKRVFLTRSNDEGLNWGAPLEVAGPESGSSVVLPFNLKAIVKGDDVVLIWSTGQPGVSCTQVTQWSNDLGVTWEERQPMPRLIPGFSNCVRQNEMVVGSDYIYLLSTIEDQTYMWAWDENRWSDPQLQRPLTSFDDPITLNSIVFGCTQTVITPEDQMIVVGCDANVGGLSDGDIWQLQRALGSIADWFPPESAWTPLTVVTGGPDPYYSQLLLANNAHEFLAFWNAADAVGGGTRDIFNARFENGRWLLPETVLTAPAALATPLTAAMDNSGQLYLGWGDASGQLYIARNDLSQAHIAAAWSPPDEITEIEAAATNPVLAVGPDNTLYLAFTIAINDGRGIYLMQSDDGGRNWEDPVPVFDGTAAEWEIVGPARLSIDGRGRLHLLWSRQVILVGEGLQTTALYYARSEDNGQTFTPATMAVEGVLSWNDLTAVGAQTVHRFWQRWDGSQLVLEHVYSQNGGGSWGRPLPVDVLDGPVSVTTDGEILILLQLTETTINEWHWRNDQWVPEASIALSSELPVGLSEQTISAYLTTNGALATLFSDKIIDQETSELFDSLQASNRVVYEGGAVEVIAETSTETPVVTETAGEPELEETAVAESTTDTGNTETPALTEETPVPTPTVPSFTNGSVSGNGGNFIMDTVLSFIPPVLLIMLVFAVGLRGVVFRRR